MINFKFTPSIFIALLCLILSACGSTQQQTKPAQLVKQQAKTKDLAVLNFNLKLEQSLNNKQLDLFKSSIDDEKILTEIKRKYSSPYLKPKDYQLRAKTVSGAITTLVANHINKGSSEWYYLYSTQIGSSDYLSHYRISFGDAGYIYMDFYLDLNSLKIYDVQNLYSPYSTLDFLIQYTDFIEIELTNFDNLEHKLKVMELIVSLERGQIKKATSAFNQLVETYRNKPILLDYVQRKLATMSAAQSQPILADLIKAYQSFGEFPGMLEAHFVEFEAYTSAIQSILQLPDSALKDVKMQSELAILNAYEGNYKQAIHHSHQAVLADPLDLEAYVAMLQVSLYSQDYELAVKAMDVINSKFDATLDQAILADFDKSDAFIMSAEYKNWLEKQSG